MSIYITGDTHGELDIAKLCRYNFDDAGMTRDDHVIVLGDFGLPWHSPEGRRDKHWLDWLALRPWTLVSILGNHENYDALASYPVVERFGGQVRQLRENVFILQNAEVYGIGGRTFFCMGGAYSVDKNWRTAGIDWWPEEVPDADARAKAEAKVAEVGAVDYVLSHCPPTWELRSLSAEADFQASPDEYNDWLQTEIADKLEFRQWFYGHMHVDRWHRRPYTSLFDVIYDLDGTGRTPFGPKAGECGSFLEALGQLSEIQGEGE